MRYKTLPLITKLQIEKDLKIQFGLQATAERNKVSVAIVRRIEERLIKWQKQVNESNSKNK